MNTIKDLYKEYISSEGGRIECYLYKSNDKYCELVNKYNSLEDDFDEMLSVEHLEHYEEILKCLTEIEQMKIGHGFNEGFMLGMQVSRDLHIRKKT